MKKIFYILCVCIVFASGVLGIENAWADDASANSPCTSSATYDWNVDGAGIISQVASHVQTLTMDTSQRLFQAVTRNPEFKSAYGGALVLFVTLYGVAALMGVVQISLADGAVRLLKFGFVVLLVENWGFFQSTVVTFFQQGTDELINKMTAVSIGAPVGVGSGPLVVLDGVISIGFGVKMMITLIALLFDWPYGPIFLWLIFWGMFTAFRAVFAAVWIYLMSLIAKALLFGLAPIFITCILFQRTRHLFDGWLSQLISYSLQPLLLFAFLGFYMVLLEASLKEILKVELCYRPIKSIFDALPNVLNQWQFVGQNQQPILGRWGIDVAYPLDIVGVLIFILLAQLAYRHTQIIQVLAREISGSTIALSELRPGMMDSIGSAQQRAAEASRAAVMGHPDGAGGHGVGGAAGAREAWRRSGGPQ